MHSRVACLILLLVPRLTPVCASIKFLASRKLKEVTSAKEQLRAQTAQLTGALRRELGPETPVPVLVVAAKDLMGEEAGNMQNEDRVGAQLLRQFAEKLSPASLILSPEEVGAASSWMSNSGADGPANNEPSMSSMSEETVIERDGSGNAVARTTRCKDGSCVQETHVAPAQDDQMRHEGLQNVLAASSDRSSTESSTDRKAQHAKKVVARRAHHKEQHARRAARKAVHHFAQAMREMKQSFGDDGFDSILEDLLASERSGRRKAADSTDHSAEPDIENSKQPARERETSNQMHQAKDQAEEPASSNNETTNQENQNEIILVGAGPASDGPVVPL